MNLLATEQWLNAALCSLDYICSLEDNLSHAEMRVMLRGWVDWLKDNAPCDPDDVDAEIIKVLAAYEQMVEQRFPERVERFKRVVEIMQSTTAEEDT